MKKIKTLPENVRNSMRSGIILFDMTRVVEELIFNSLDSGATKISIFVGVVTCCIKVVDDGCGMSRDGLVLLGDRYATSKLQDFADMEVTSESFGFRGEALASISDISLLEIATKAVGRPNGYRKVMKGSKCIYLGIDDDREDVGTTVVVRDLFYNQPVRRKYMQSSPKKILHSVKKCVLRIALVHSNVLFSLIDIESDEELLRTNSSSSPLSLLMNASGIDDPLTPLHKVDASDGTIKIVGCISIPGDSFGIKAFQYLYINSRFLSKGPIHKLLNQLAISYDCLNLRKTSDVPQRGKRSRPQANPTYILNLTCPRCLYDLTFEPSNTHVEFKDWEPILKFVEKVIQALWKKDIALESVGEHINMLEKDKASVILMEDDILESTRKKLRRQNLQTSSNLLYSPSDDQTRDGDYLSNRKYEWTPCPEFKEQIEGIKEQDIEGKIIHNHKKSSWDGTMLKKEEFPWMYHAGDLLATNNSPSIDNNFRKQSKELGFDFDKFDNELDVNCRIRKPFLHCRTSSGSLAIDEPMIRREEFESFTGPFETKHKDVFSDRSSVTLEVQERSTSLGCSPGTSKRDGDLFGLPCPRECNEGEMEADFNTFSQDPAELFPSCEEPFIKKKFDSASLVANFDREHQFSSSYWRHFNQLSETMWDSDCFTCSGVLDRSSRWQRMPNYGNLANNEDNNFKSDDEILSQTSPQENCEAIWSDSFFDVKDNTDFDKGFNKFLKRNNLHVRSYQVNYSGLGDEMGQNLKHANHIGIDSYESQKDESRYQELKQNHVPGDRPRRSLSAPPFYWQKKRFVSLSHRKFSFTVAADDKKHLQQSSGASYRHLEPNFTSQNMKNKTDSVSNMNFSVDYRRSLHSQPQEDARIEEIVLEENQDPVNSFTKWRHNSSSTKVKASKQSHVVEDQDSMLDISSGFLRNLAGESLIPVSMNRNFLEDAKVLLQVDKKFIPVVSGSTLAIIDQHAADERIRLEELRRKVLAGEEKTITYLDAEQELMLPEMGYQLLQSYAEQIKDWGWICNINVEGPKSFKKNMSILSRQPTTVTLLSVPCILGVNLSDADLLEFLQQLADTDGSSTIPSSVLRVLNSKACRGAIMFGDSLLPSECSLIVEELKQTSLCFQCAHGRPTIAPLVDMKALHKQITNIGSNQLWHGLLRHKISLDRARMRLQAAQC